MGANRFVNIVHLLSRSVSLYPNKNYVTGPLNSLCYLYKLVISIGTHSFNHSVYSP